LPRFRVRLPLAAAISACVGVAGCAGGTRVGGPASTQTPAVDGSWELAISRADLVAAGATGDGLVPGNYGVARMVLDNGRFAVTGHNGPVCTWAYGKFVISGNRIELRFDGGGGVSPMRSFNQPGEIFDYRWSVYHDSMTWSVVPDAISPFGWTLKPWRMKSRTPSARYLDKSCLPPANALSG
jgi:hypothetical protein